MYRDTTTLEEIYRLALPKGSQILYGKELLDRPVSWACSLRPSPPAFPNLEGEELALIDIEDLRQFDPPGSCCQQPAPGAHLRDWRAG